MSGDLEALLRSDRARDRLRAARELAQTTDQTLLNQVVQARKCETDSWVQSALERVLQRWRVDADAYRGPTWLSAPDSTELDDIRAEAIREVSQTLLHESRPLISQVVETARAAIEEYETSSTAKAMRRLLAFLDTVQRLEQASTAPRFEELDLTDLVASVTSAINSAAVPIRVTRTDPLFTTADRDLLSMALTNVLRNAVEATTDGSPVIVNSAVTDSDAWIAVLDQGLGLPAGGEEVWKVGRTGKSKRDHFGWGLPIAERAMRSMGGGKIRLTPRDPTGTSCELRWQPPEVDRARTDS